MPDNVETMMYQNETPWHGLGTHLDHPPTAEEAIKAGGMDWEVTPEEIYVREPDGRYRVVSADESQNHRAMVRSKDRKVLAVAGAQYTPLQNRHAFKSFDPFVQSGFFEYETAGVLNGGRRVWILAALKDGVADVVKGDPIRAYVLLSNTHDGSSPVMTLTTNIRVVCANTMAAAMTEGKRIAKARHTASVVWKVEQMQETMAAFSKVFKDSLETYRFLTKAKMSDKAIELYVKALFGKDKDSEQLPRGGARIIELFSTGKGNDLPGVRGTAWAAYNAVTQHIDHERGGEGANAKEAQAKQEQRLMSAWFGQGADVKKKALELAVQGAMAINNAA